MVLFHVALRRDPVSIIIIIITPLDFFPSASPDGLLQEFEWQQVQDSSQYSGRSQWCSSLDGLHSSFYFQVL